MLNAPLNVNIYERSLTSSPGIFYADLGPRLSTYAHTITDHFGFETMACSFNTTAQGAMRWLTEALFRPVIVYGPDANIVWEGFVETVEAQIGGEVRSVSLRDMANRVRVRYTTVLDTPGVTATSSNTASQALYGVKDGVFTIDKSDSTEAGHFQATMLARLAYPIAAPSATVATGEPGSAQVTFQCAGWYATLDWVLTSNTSTTKTSTTTQIGTLLTTLSSTNAFLSTSTANITASGITAVEFIDPDSSYRQKFESLLGRGNGTNPYAWGIYEGRAFYAAAYAGATPSTITYYRKLEQPYIRTAAGATVLPWSVRPNAMYQVEDLLDTAPVSTAKDSAARFYVGRVSCALAPDAMTLTLEPTEPSDLSAILVTKYG